MSNGGSQRTGAAGNAVSIIDVDRASVDAEDAEVARVLVETDDPEEETHPLISSATPDGREVIVPNVRANNVSIVVGNAPYALAVVEKSSWWPR